jgi:hypothetical protein
LVLWIEKQGYGPLRATGVRGNDNAVFGIEVFPDVSEERRLGVEVVDGDAEEALDLGSVEVDRHDVCCLLEKRPASAVDKSSNVRLAPAVCSMFATRRALMGARDLSFLS